MATEYAPTYWNEKGKYEKEYGKFWKKLVPGQGEAETQHGELLRSISRVYYRFFNDGDKIPDMLDDFVASDHPAYDEINYVNFYAGRNNLDIKLEEGITAEDLDKIMDVIIEHIIKKETK